MCELYKRINTLCEKRGITGYKLCKDVEMRPSILTDLKMGRTAILSTVNLNKIANYFSVAEGKRLQINCKITLMVQLRCSESL